MWNPIKKPKKIELFPLQDGDIFETVDTTHDDKFFDEAFSNPNSAYESNKSFVGSMIPKVRFQIAGSIIILFVLVFVGKASALQIINGAEYRLQAESNRTRSRTILSQRGVIYDRNGYILAENDPTFHIITSKNNLPNNQTEYENQIQNLSTFLNISQEELLNKIFEADAPNQEILIAENLDYETGIAFEATSTKFSAFSLETGSRRSYVTDLIPSLSHILGYTGPLNKSEYEELKDQGYRGFDHIGKQGIEAQYEDLLRGEYGKEVIEVDAIGSTQRIISKTDAKNGENIYLTIDARLQSYIENSVVEHVEGTEVSRGSIIVMNPKNGEILSMVSWPTYDANIFTSGIGQDDYSALLNDPNTPLFPRAFAGEFPSGSTIKPVNAAAALMEGIIDTKTSFPSTGGIYIDQWFFPDWRAGGHGITNIYHAIADSVNTFFYMIGGGKDEFDGLGIEKMMEYAYKFGFGRKTGLDLPGEGDGFLPSKEWKIQAKDEVWYIGDTYHAAIGQGDFLVTPLQIAQSTAIFANDGVRITPHLYLNANIEAEQVTDAETTEIIKDAMRRTVTRGTAKSLNSLPITSAGKTGTAQWSSTRPNHSWYTGFAPFEDPEIVVTVLVEEGADDYLAVPIAEDILNWWAENR